MTHIPDPPGEEVYGRIVGVAVVADDSVLISDNGQKLIWRFFHGPLPSTVDELLGDNSRTK